MYHLSRSKIHTWDPAATHTHNTHIQVGCRGQLSLTGETVFYHFVYLLATKSPALCGCLLDGRGELGQRRDYEGKTNFIVCQARAL